MSDGKESLRHNIRRALSNGRSGTREVYDYIYQTRSRANYSWNEVAAELRAMVGTSRKTNKNAYKT
jgi:hypothetical protein